MVEISQKGVKRGTSRNMIPVVVVVFAVSWLVYVIYSDDNASFLTTSTLFDLDTISNMSLNGIATNAPNHEMLELLEKRLIANNVPPVSCAQVLMQVRTGKTTDPNDGRLYARYAKESMHFWISVHNGKYDPTRFSMFEEFGYYYESDLSKAFNEVLKGKTQSRVLDVGGNIGWFALLSASLGAQVATFEPLRVNYLRMCESMCLNGWLHGSSNAGCMSGSPGPFLQERIHIFPYPVSERKEQLYFHENAANPGQSHVHKNPLVNSTPVETVTLDGMINALGWTNADIDILKVDVEGAEVGVFFGAKQLLQSNRVQNIFMEGNLRSDGEKDDFQKIAKLLVESDYVLHRIGGWKGPDSMNVPAVDDKFYSNLMDTCGDVGLQSHQCNIWWKVKHVL